ncbi:CHASE2 domain-containing protein [Erythrobacter sp.]|uniref:CHASE2 domain-containing protein n=1 Tax=Erythrobacter sp. TaxID=1042 RepID=UPI002EC9A9E7|nr:CHASE2 domain-containing protein [Erythrobacter sp.]
MSRSEPGSGRAARRILAAAILGGAIFGVLLSLVAGDFQRRLVFDGWQRLAPLEASADRVAVVMIDDPSVAAIGEWPWRRYDVAVLLERIAAADPAAIGVDIFFVEPDRLRPASFLELYTEDAIDPATRERIGALPSGDDALADVIASSPVVMPWVVSQEGGRPASELTFEHIEGTLPAGAIRTQRMLTSLPAFDDVALARGIVSAPPDPDGVTRRVPLGVIAGGETAPGFTPVLAAQVGGNADLRWTKGGMAVGDRVVPGDDRAHFAFRMARGWEALAIPAIEVLRGKVAPGEFSGKIVLVGFGATGTSDIVATPLAGEVQGTLVQAQAVDAILTGNWLARPAWITAIEVAIAALLIALFLAAGVTANNRWLVAAALGALVLPFASFALFARANLLLDPARPLLIAGCAALALLLARYSLMVIELIEKRILAAEQAKENESARALQLTMVPSPARLAQLGRRTEIGAVLEPARSVGGDFYDAMDLGDDRLAFLVGDVSGKGLPAALFMALSKSVSKNNVMRMGHDLEAAIRRVNDELMAEEDQEMDLTLLVGVIDCASGEVQMINAGHEDPLIVRADGRVEVAAMRGGVRMRTFEGFPYRVESLTLAPDETLVVISDGATDASDARGARFGLNGVMSALAQSGDNSAQIRAQDLALQVRAFERGTDPADDLTILALRYLGEEAA